MNRNVTIETSGRGGTIRYRDEAGSIPFDWEFGGEGCIAIIFLPTEAQWRDAYQRSAGEAEEIVQFVAAETIRQKAPGCVSRISDRWIDIINA
jgi:hypothetical protein